MTVPVSLQGADSSLLLSAKLSHHGVLVPDQHHSTYTLFCSMARSVYWGTNALQLPRGLHVPRNSLFDFESLLYLSLLTNTNIGSGIESNLDS